ncbi:MAG: lipase family protein [Methylococcales bacterium]
MSILTPKEAALLANKVYDVKNEEDWKAITSNPKLPISTQTAFAGFYQNPTRGVGESGWGQKSGFAYMANGTGNRHGESLVAIRGTSSLADALTDARMSFAHSPSGHVVHRGFSLAYQSIKPSINSYFKQPNNNPSQIHVVGHSLGGAIACLVAEQLSLQGHNVSLYTFGCPRVGDNFYSKTLDQLLGGASNIYRVYHEADPVSMIPIYPFVPVSNSAIGHQLPWNGSTVSVYAHLMNNYISSVIDCSWNSLPKAQNSDFFQSMDVWLEQVGNSGGNIKMFSCSSLRLILKALQWVLSSIKSVSSAIAQFTLSGGAIVVDVLAYLLYQGCLLTAEIAGYVKSILKSILKFMGRTIDATANVTVSFIQFVLDMFFRVISTAASQALYLLP